MLMTVARKKWESDYDMASGELGRHDDEKRRGNVLPIWRRLSLAGAVAHYAQEGINEGTVKMVMVSWRSKEVHKVMNEWRSGVTSPKIEREQWEKGDGFHKFEAFEI